MIYLFKHDSTHGSYPLSLECDNEFIIISGGKYNFNCTILKKLNQKDILNFILICNLYFINITENLIIFIRHKIQSV